MKVSVVIPVFNEEKYIEKCLKSVLSQSEKAQEVIVVDNNCTDGTMQIVKKFPGVRIVQEKKQGMTPARNKGFTSAKYEIIVRTDADTIVPKHWIASIKSHFQNDPDLCALSGPAKMYGIDRLRQKTYFQGEILYFQAFQKIFHHDCLLGPNMALRKKVWKSIYKEVCMADNIVHEDIDLAIHVARFGKVLLDLADKNLVVFSSARRWKKIKTHLEYPYRYFRTLQHHKRSLHGLKTGTQRVAATSLRIAKSITR